MKLNERSPIRHFGGPTPRATREGCPLAGLRATRIGPVMTLGALSVDHLMFQDEKEGTMKTIFRFGLWRLKDRLGLGWDDTALRARKALGSSVAAETLGRWSGFHLFRRR